MIIHSLYPWIWPYFCLTTGNDVEHCQTDDYYTPTVLLHMPSCSMLLHHMYKLPFHSLNILSTPSALHSGYVQSASVDSIDTLSSRNEKNVLWWNALRKTTWRWTAGLIALQASVQIAKDWRREIIFLRTVFTSIIISSFQWRNKLLV